MARRTVEFASLDPPVPQLLWHRLRILDEHAGPRQHREAVLVQLVEAASVHPRLTLEDVRRLDLAWIGEAEGADDLEGSLHRRSVQVGHALRLGVHVEARLERRILRGDTCRALVGVALEGLDAPEGGRVPLSPLFNLPFPSVVVGGSFY